MDDKVQLAARIPKKYNDKLLMLANNKGINKTEVLIQIMASYFNINEPKQQNFIDAIDDVFSIEKKIFLPVSVYKKLLSKTDSELESEISKGLANIVNVAAMDFIVIDANMDINAIAVELLIQKKNIELLNEKFWDCSQLKLKS